MIKDKLENAMIYYGISENLKKGFEWLKSQNFNSLEEKKYYVDTDKIYANVQKYPTRTDAKYEAHRKYIDIQYLIKGRELVGVCDIKNCKPSVPYDKDADIEFMDLEEEDEWQNLREGEFLVLFPNDAHKPSMTPNDLGKTENIVKKVVVKVAIN